MPLEVRALRDAEVGLALPLLQRIRDHLSVEEIERRVALQRELGYQLVGAFSGGDLIGVLGGRVVQTLGRGGHLHIDDLALAPAVRGEEVASALLRFAETEARERGLAAVFLDCRSDAVAFYGQRGYTPHSTVLLRKHLPTLH